jgi:hypothetical protein
MNLDRWIVNVDDAVDSPGHSLAECILLWFADALGVQERGVGRIQRHNDPSLQDGKGRVWGVIS